jgi:hypothetical protein
MTTDRANAHLNPGLRKLENVRRDARVAVSFEGTEMHGPGLKEYLVAHRTVRITVDRVSGVGNS